MSVAIFLSSVKVSEGSHSTSSGCVSSNCFDGPVISSLSCASSGGCSLSLLEMEVGFSTHSGDSVRMSMFLTRCWGTSCLYKSESVGKECLLSYHFLPKNKDNKYKTFNTIKNKLFTHLV